MTVKAKICGISTAEAAKAAVAGGAAYVGLNFFARSPRYVSPAQAAALAPLVPLTKVGLFVDAEDDLIDAALPSIDMLQLHGKESPARIAALKARTGKPVMRAVPIAEAADVVVAHGFEHVADMLLLDAKPLPGASRPGGHGVSFNWTLLQGQTWTKPWMLAGGLTPENVAAAVAATGAAIVDVSSGVESAPGVKDPARIAAFLDAVRRL